MEHAIGTRITLEVVEASKDYRCDGCFFDAKDGCVETHGWCCLCRNRTDGKSIIYKEIKGKE